MGIHFRCAWRCGDVGCCFASDGSSRGMGPRALFYFGLAEHVGLVRRIGIHRSRTGVALGLRAVCGSSYRNDCSKGRRQPPASRVDSVRCLWSDCRRAGPSRGVDTPMGRTPVGRCYYRLAPQQYARFALIQQNSVGHETRCFSTR